MEILNTVGVYEVADWATIVIRILTIIDVFLIGFIVACWTSRRERPFAEWAIPCLLCVAIALIALNLFAREKHTRYEVRISDEVSFNDIYSRYEIVEVRGKIYTIEERK